MHLEEGENQHNPPGKLLPHLEKMVKKNQRTEGEGGREVLANTRRKIRLSSFRHGFT